MDTSDRHSAIAQRAYAIWETEGRPSGGDLEHWLRAEAEVDAAQRARSGKTGSTKRRRRDAGRAEPTG